MSLLSWYLLVSKSLNHDSTGQQWNAGCLKCRALFGKYLFGGFVFSEKKADHSGS
jgi:hypothetical protein